MSATDLLALFAQFLALSMLTVGGAITVAPEMHRFVVDQRGWIGDSDFTTAIALAQSSPGPNILFVTLIGLSAGGWLGALATTVGILLPSSVFALWAFRWTRRRNELPWVKAFRAGMTPITIGMLLATGWILFEPNVRNPYLVAITLATIAVVVRTRLNPLWLIGAGGIAGVLGVA